jgi:hypothetical protein
MTRTEQNRLKKILEYKKGYLDALLWIQNSEPYDEVIELRIDIYTDKIEELQNKLKGHDE